MSEISLCHYAVVEGGKERREKEILKRNCN